MAANLRTRKGHYYLRIRVPTDLLNTIPEPEILKSLHTKDRKSAHVAVSCTLPGILQVFTLTRTGFISKEQATERLNTILGRNQKGRAKQAPLQHVTPTTPPSPLFSEMVNEYIEDQQSGWTGKTLLEYRSYFKLLQDVLGVQRIADITREEVRKLRDTLCQLPANLYKKHPGKSIKLVLEMGNITPMSTTTVNKLLTRFSSIMLHCVKEGHLRDNPAEGLKIQKKKRPDEERKAYSTDNLMKIVATLPSPDLKPERYWIPLIGMLSGMRLGEICGLRIEDVKRVDGIMCFDVNDEHDKRLKNQSSKRLVPIHPQLIQKGLLLLVDTLRDKGYCR